MRKFYYVQARIKGSTERVVLCNDGRWRVDHLYGGLWETRTKLYQRRGWAERWFNKPPSWAMDMEVLVMW